MGSTCQQLTRKGKKSLSGGKEVATSVPVLVHGPRRDGPSAMLGLWILWVGPKA